MTRKRFIKLMQSKGMQRNEAVIFAEEVRNIPFLSGKSPYEVFSHATIEGRYGRRFILQLKNRYAFLAYDAIKKHSQAVVYTGDSGYKWWLRSPEPIHAFVAGVAPGFCI